MFLVAVGELVMRYVSTPRVRLVCVLAFLIAALAAIGQAEAACSPNAPVNNASIICSGLTNGQNGIAGYGTNADTGNTMTVQSSASVMGTSFGVILQSGTVNNFGGVFGGTLNPTGRHSGQHSYGHEFRHDFRRSKRDGHHRLQRQR
jgi:uncharacterized membrane protein YoaK (UPF0700 family)